MIFAICHILFTSVWRLHLFLNVDVNLKWFTSSHQKVIMYTYSMYIGHCYANISDETRFLLPNCLGLLWDKQIMLWPIQYWLHIDWLTCYLMFQHISFAYISHYLLKHGIKLILAVHCCKNTTSRLIMTGNECVNLLRKNVISLPDIRIYKVRSAVLLYYFLWPENGNACVLLQVRQQVVVDSNKNVILSYQEPSNDNQNICRTNV